MVDVSTLLENVITAKLNNLTLLKYPVKSEHSWFLSCNDDSEQIKFQLHGGKFKLRIEKTGRNQ